MARKSLRTRSDYFTFGGANILADRVRAYWRMRGRQVAVVVEPMERIASNQPQMFVVRSNLLNALPRAA